MYWQYTKHILNILFQHIIFTVYKILLGSHTRTNTFTSHNQPTPPSPVQYFDTLRKVQQNTPWGHVKLSLQTFVQFFSWVIDKGFLTRPAVARAYYRETCSYKTSPYPLPPIFLVQLLSFLDKNYFYFLAWKTLTECLLTPWLQPVYRSKSWLISCKPKETIIEKWFTGVHRFMKLIIVVISYLFMPLASLQVLNSDKVRPVSETGYGLKKQIWMPPPCVFK